MSAVVEPVQKGEVRGFLHHPERANGSGVALTHGASGHAGSPLLTRVAEAFSEAGFVVLRFDLPYRQKRPTGSPPFGSANKDQANIREAADFLRSQAIHRVFLSGHSYGGRQASLLAAEDGGCADGLVLLSYPLRPPGKTEMRVAHFPSLRMPTLFVHGTRDPFGKPEEVRSAMAELGGVSSLSIVDKAGHDLRAGNFDVQVAVVEALRNIAAV